MKNQICYENKLLYHKRFITKGFERFRCDDINMFVMEIYRGIFVLDTKKDFGRHMTARVPVRRHKVCYPLFVAEQTSMLVKIIKMSNGH